MYKVWDRSAPAAGHILRTRSWTVRLKGLALFETKVIVYTVCRPLDLRSRPLFATKVIVYKVWDRSCLGQKLLCTRCGTVRLQEPALFETKVIVYMVWDRSVPVTGLVWDRNYCVNCLRPFGSSSRPCLRQKIIVYTVWVRSAPGSRFYLGQKLLCTQSGTV